MYSFIRKLQSKPEEVRKQMLVVFLVISMTGVGVVWVYGLTDRFSGERVIVKKDDTISSPFKLFKDSISSAYTNISASVGKLSSDESEPAAVPSEENSQKQIELIPVEPSGQ